MSIQLSRELAAVRAERDFADRMLADAEEIRGIGRGGVVVVRTIEIMSLR